MLKDPYAETFFMKDMNSNHTKKTMDDEARLYRGRIIRYFPKIKDPINITVNYKGRMPYSCIFEYAWKWWKFIFDPNRDRATLERYDHEEND